MTLPDKPDDGASKDESLLRQAVRLPPGDRSLAGKILEGGDFMFAELAGVDLTEADFYWASFRDATLETAIMARCDLRGASFHGANLRHADLSGAKCGFDNLGGPTRFIKADLSGANLRNADIAGADFTGALLVEADLPACARPARCPGARHGFMAPI